jgi:ribosomal protein L23
MKYPVLTEKTIRLLEKNQYTFDVDKNLPKQRLKSGLKVSSVLK